MNKTLPRTRAAAPSGGVTVVRTPQEAMRAAGGRPGPVIDMRGVGEAMGQKVAEVVREELRKPPEGVRSMQGLVKALKALNEAQGSAGGFSVPEELAASIFATPVPSIVRPRAQVYTMGRRALRVATLNQGDAPGLLGGMALAWTAEGAALAETDPELDAVTFGASKLAGVVYVSEELLEDSSPSAEALIRTTFARAVAWHTDKAGLVGTGTGQPAGALIGPGAVAVNRANSGQARKADLRKLLGKFHPAGYGAGAVFLASPTAWEDLLTDLDLAGRPAVFAGIPIVPCEFLPALGTARDLALVDLASYAIADRSLGVALSREVRALQGQVAVRLTWRADGGPLLTSDVPLDGDANTRASAFVYLN